MRIQFWIMIIAAAALGLAVGLISENLYAGFAGGLVGAGIARVTALAISQWSARKAGRKGGKKSKKKH